MVSAPLWAASRTDRNEHIEKGRQCLPFFLPDHLGFAVYIGNNSMKRMNMHSCQKHRLPKLLETFDASLTEGENMRNSGFYRLWDCGNAKWEWTN